MDFQTVRERMAEFLNRNGVEAVCAYPDGGRTRRDGAVAAVSVRACQGGPEGFRDYLGERYDEATGQWQELYGRRIILTLGLDLYAPRGCGAAGIQAAYDRLAEALQWDGPTGLVLQELSCGETEFDREAGLSQGPVWGVGGGFISAGACVGGSFCDFFVRGEVEV